MKRKEKGKKRKAVLAALKRFCSSRSEFSIVCRKRGRHLRSHEIAICEHVGANFTAAQVMAIAKQWQLAIPEAGGGESDCVSHRFDR